MPACICYSRAACQRQVLQLSIATQDGHAAIVHPLALAEVQPSQARGLHQVRKAAMAEVCAAGQAQLLEACMISWLWCHLRTRSCHHLRKRTADCLFGRRLCTKAH